MDANLIAAIKLHPGVLDYLTPEKRRAFYKAAPLTRDELERKVARAILGVDRQFLSMLENAGAANIPFDFWQQYQTQLRAEIASPMRQYIEQSFTNYSDYVNFIDKTGAVGDIDTLMTRAITDSANGIAETTRKQLQAMLQDGISQDEIIERISLRFGSGHAEQVAVTEITRAESYFSDALSSRLTEQGVDTNTRWIAKEDEKMCPICRKLDNKLKPWTLDGVPIQGPPAHPRCRCTSVVELKR
jgi:SPP1 gp7 family putative phage head morphogenesis protein